MKTSCCWFGISSKFRSWPTWFNVSSFCWEGACPISTTLSSSELAEGVGSRPGAGALRLFLGAVQYKIEDRTHKTSITYGHSFCEKIPDILFVITVIAKTNFDCITECLLIKRLNHLCLCAALSGAALVPFMWTLARCRVMSLLIRKEEPQKSHMYGFSPNGPQSVVLIYVFLSMWWNRLT